MKQGDILYTSSPSGQFFDLAGNTIQKGLPSVKPEYETLLVDSEGRPTAWRDWDGTERTPEEIAVIVASTAGEALSNILSSNMTIMFDNGVSGETDYSGNGNDATHSGSSTASATGYQGNLPFFSFNGTDDIFTVADADNLSFGDGTTDQPFWIFSVYNVTDDSSNKILISKWDETTGSQQREWLLQFGGVETPLLALYDNSEASAAQITGAGSTASPPRGVFASILVYYDGRGGSDAGDGIQIAINGSPITVSPSSAANYVAMENTTSPVVIGAREGSGGSFERFFDGSLGITAVGGGSITDFTSTAQLLHTNIAERFYQV